MIIKKLKQVSGGVFPGAAYSETKVEQGVADFAGTANVDGNFLFVLSILHEAGVNCAHEVEQYLQDHSNTFGNSKSTRLQFHYALSVLISSTSTATRRTITCISSARGSSPTARCSPTIKTSGD